MIKTAHHLKTHLKTALFTVPLVLLLAACGGGGGVAPGEEESATEGPPAASTGDTSTPAQPPSRLGAGLPVPTDVASGATVVLECGRLYQGTLDLRGKTDVTVTTAGTCGNAMISPGAAPSGWTRHEGDIFSAPVSFDLAQLSLDGQPLPLAHWPNRPQTWVKAQSSTATSLTYPMPNADLVGATLVFRPYPWTIEARRITAYSGNTLSLARLDNPNFDGYGLQGQVDFYVEGKLWMLDSPGEWVVSDGRLYLWSPDGRSPEGRVWASPDRDGIDARNSQNIVVSGVDIYGAANGINARDARGLRVSRVNISNSSANGIVNTGGRALQVDSSSIRNSRHDGIAVKWGGGEESIRNNRIEASGSIGMPTNAHAGINLTLASGSVVANNIVTNSGYIGIRVFRNATVSGNRIEGACLVLTDCGGVYADAAIDRAPLNTRIENNIISGVAPGQRLAWGVFLGEHANAVTVAGNTITGNGNGVQILNAYGNLFTGNTFARNTQAHIQMVEYGSAPMVTQNVVTNNTFTSANRAEMYRLSSELGSGALSRFSSYSGNRYITDSSVFANYQGQLLSFQEWQTRTGQDSDSTLTTP